LFRNIKKKAEMLNAGANAPNFSLPDTSGTPQSLQEALTRGPVLVAVYKSSCPVSQMTLPYLDRISRGSAGNRLQIIAISQDDESTTRQFRDKFKLNLPTLFDREEDGYVVSNAYGVSHVPSLFLVETDGSISLASSGFAKRDIESIGERAGVHPFGPGDKVPEWKAG
jgi:peroxiredoxin